MSVSSLKLFGVVPEVEGIPGRAMLIEEYGTIVAPEASYAIKEIRAFLKQTGVGYAEKNSSFWKDWQTIRNMSDFEQRLDQLLHYVSTYGLDYYGIDSVKNGLVYIPNNVFNTDQPFVLRTIQAMAPTLLLKRCFALLESGMALSQETIKDILIVLDELHYEITGDEKIANREAEVYFFHAANKLPNDSTRLFRCLLYYFTDQTMVINDKKTKELIASSMKALPSLSVHQEIALAQSFNRYKELWMAIKKTNRKNGPAVNRITRLSKIHHVPMPEVVMNNLTSKSYTIEQVTAAAKKATVFQIVRAVNGLRLRQERPQRGVYRIRNSKIWTKLTAPTMSAKSTYFWYEDALISELRQRIGTVKVYAPEYADYAFPTSEKSFVGNVPEGTVLRFEKTSEFLLVGVHWDDPYTDLDLRADSVNLSIGWNSSLRSGNRGIMFSGDMTRAPKPWGASEWFYFRDFDGVYNLKLNLFSGSDFSKKFKFMIGRSSTAPSRDYHINPEDVLVSYVVPMEERQLSLGMIYSEKDSICFMLGTGSTGGRRVGYFSKYDGVQQDVAIKRIKSSLRLNDVISFVKTPAEADVDLSLDKLTKDSFLSLC